MKPAFAELAVTSNFSFLRGGSHPHELVETAKALGLSAIGIADRNTLAGAVRAHTAAKEEGGIRLVIGVRLILRDGFETICFPTSREAYGRLTRLLTLGNRRAPKGECHLSFDDLVLLGEGQRLIAMPPYDFGEAFTANLQRLTAYFPGCTYLAASLYYRSVDRARLDRLAELSMRCGAPLIATNDILYHAPERRPLQDVLTCIREHCTIDEAGFRLEANAERHIKPASEMLRLFPGYEDAVLRTMEIVKDCEFSLSQLKYEYPDEPTGESATPQEELERLTWIGVHERFAEGIDGELRSKIEHELALIAELKYARYFLTVYDIVRFARTQEQPILCQGRGSAANSIVCFCLGITSVNPKDINLLVERFISVDRNEPPDIDVDFEHERREEVIQHIYKKYERHRAGIAATLITYQTRSAVREVGKVMGLSPDVVSALAGMVWGTSSEGVDAARIREVGLDPADKRLVQTVVLTLQLIGFPRHLSQHVGGFVITRGPLEEMVPIANAAMEDRTMIEWDRDDLAEVGMLKVDVLALGMLTCLRKSFDLLKAHYGVAHTLATVPREDKATYKMIQKADTIGIFQIESRAQMSMLPRLRPKDFYDLVIQIAIVRPGPIQGDMVHPYLRRRDGIEKVEYPSEALRAVLEKTLGVPLFQEQAMKIAMVGAGFSGPKANQLRRAMASFRNHGTIETLREDFINGMLKNKYPRDFAERCFKQIEGFSDYGFPESHSASFALLAYASSWLKCHYPDVFACALLNSQPMGFYSASSIVRDFRDHGGEVRSVDINHSDWDHTLEPADKSAVRTETGGSTFALRLGLRQIDGMKEEAAKRIAAARGRGFDSVRDLYFRGRADMGTLQRLARADAFRSIGLDRRAGLWAVRGLSSHLGGSAAVEDLPLFSHASAGPLVPFQQEEEVELPPLLLGEHVIDDYATLTLSLKAHPVSFLRPRLNARNILRSAMLVGHPAEQTVLVAGLVLVRQRPSTAKGTIFMTIEDESGIANIIVWPKIYESHRRIVLGARIIAIEGTLQREREVIHVIARRIFDLSGELFDSMTTANVSAPAFTGAPSQMPPSLWRHPRDTRVLPKGRNFH